MGARHFHGLEIALRSLSGARAVRVVHPPGQHLPPHRHDWPFLTINLTGAYRQRHDSGEARLEGAALALHPAGGAHEDAIGAAGLETVSIAFDPDWLKTGGNAVRLDHAIALSGGRSGAAARRLAALWADPSTPAGHLAEATASLIALAMAAEPPPRPHWHERAARALGADQPPATAALARRLGLHPAFLARAWRAAAGEGIAETIRRTRVERAAILLRNSDLPLAAIAAESGFCDQSHMNRCFRALIGRTPLAVRSERAALQALAG